MTERTRASWLVYALGALAACAVAGAILVVGPASGSQTAATRTATVAQGVVQSTVSGTGNLQPASQLNLGFKTAGTVTNIYVTQGQQVTQGQLIAALDPQSAEVTLEQAKATLQAAEANLAKEEETDGESSGSAAGNSGGTASASTASVAHDIATAYSPPNAASPTAQAPSATTPTSTPATGSAPGSPTTTTAPTSTTPTTTAPSTATTPSTSTTTSPAATTPSTRTGTRESKESTSKESTGSSTTPTISAATREANLASARADVKSEKLTVQSDEQAVQNTRLYAPESGTIASLTGQVGETVSGGGTTRASSSSSSSGSSGSSAAAAGGAGTGSSKAATGASGASSSSGSSSSSSFAVLSDLSSMQLVVPLSESEIGNVKVGQIATVTIEALGGRKVAAHVAEVAILSTSDSGVVSYDVTFQLDQLEAGIKPGMSATAEVVVKQAEGINVPTTAISADTVTVLRGGKDVRQRVVTGLAGNSSTIVLSGLKAGETIVLPSTSTSSSALSSLTSRRGGLGGGGLGGGGLAAGGGGAAFFRGGG